MSRLELRWNQWHGFGVSFLDYIVDGGSVWSDHRVGHEVNEIPLLGWQPVSADALLRDSCSRPPDLGERTAIFVCGSCGDLDCGAFSVVIERDGDDIVWRDPASGTPDYGVNEVLPPMHSTPSGAGVNAMMGSRSPTIWTRSSALTRSARASTTWPAELRFDYREYREAIVNRPPSVSTRR